MVWGLEVKVVVQALDNLLLIVIDIISGLLQRDATICSSLSDNSVVVARHLTVELVPFLLGQLVVEGREPARLKGEPDPKPDCPCKGKAATDDGIAFRGTEV
jgi:hypothetical protein